MFKRIYHIKFIFSGKRFEFIPLQKTYFYSYTSTMGSVNQTAMENWEQYLAKYREYIVSGTHFTNFAVQVRFVLEIYNHPLLVPLCC